MSGGASSLAQLVGAFGGVKRDEVEVPIESLAALGSVVAYGGEGEARRYRMAGRAAA